MEKISNDCKEEKENDSQGQSSKVEIIPNGSKISIWFQGTSTIKPIVYESHLNVEFSHIEKANNTFLQAGNLRVHVRSATNSAGCCKFKIEYSSQHPAEIFASCQIL